MGVLVICILKLILYVEVAKQKNNNIISAMKKPTNNSNWVFLTYEDQEWPIAKKLGYTKWGKYPNQSIRLSKRTLKRIQAQEVEKFDLNQERPSPNLIVWLSALLNDLPFNEARTNLEEFKQECYRENIYFPLNNSYVKSTWQFIKEIIIK